MDISVVIPLLNEEESLPELVSWIDRVMIENQFRYELILIDDGSTDDSWAIIDQLSKEYSSVKGIKFVRNYGKSAALHTGFQITQGEVVITMDADLQDSPDEIPALYDLIKKDGYDLISGWKKKRYDPLSKTIPTKIFNGATRLVSGISLNDFNCGLKAYKSKVVKSIEVYGEMHRYIPVIAKWGGFKKIGEKEVQHRARKYGVTKFGLERFVHGFLDLISITFVSKFSRRPMHFFGTFGMLSFLAGIAITMFLIGYKIYAIQTGVVQYRDVTDQPLFYLALTALVLGSQLFLAGFLGEMIARNNPYRNEYNIDKKINIL